MSQVKVRYFLVTIYDSADFNTIKSRHISTDRWAAEQYGDRKIEELNEEDELRGWRYSVEEIPSLTLV